MKQNSMAASDAIRTRYIDICQHLGYRDAPNLMVSNSELTMLGRAIGGSYRPRKHVIEVPLSPPPSDALIVHELVHAAAAGKARYFGHHGAPYLALLQLVHDLHFDRKCYVIADTARRNWSRWHLHSFRQREVRDAWRAVIRIKRRIPEKYSNRFLPELALLVRQEFPHHVMSWRRPWLRYPAFDLLQTQGDGWHSTVVSGLVYQLIIAAIAWWLLQKPWAAAWVKLALLALALWVLLGGLVQRFRNLRRRVISWKAKLLARFP